MSGEAGSTVDPEGAGRVVVATIGAPHGVRGELRVRAWTEDPLAIRGYAPLTLPDGRALELVSARPHKNALVCRFRGVDTREAAALLTNAELSVPRDVLPAEEEGEFYLDDLVGLLVIDGDGAARGEVVAVHDFGAGEVLEIARPDGGRCTDLIPFSEAAVPAIDIEAGTLTVEPVAAGLEDGPSADGDREGRPREGGSRKEGTRASGRARRPRGGGAGHGSRGDRPGGAS